MLKIKSGRTYHCSEYVDNILSILLYCNFNDLQHHLSQSYRLMDQNDTLHQMMKRHEQYTNWAVLIYQTVSLFGCLMTNSQEFYRGISGKTVISNTRPCLYSPTS
eukprot:392089_1